jgi:hypothetical protein
MALKATSGPPGDEGTHSFRLGKAPISKSTRITSASGFGAEHAKRRGVGPVVVKEAPGTFSGVEGGDETEKDDDDDDSAVGKENMVEDLRFALESIAVDTVKLISPCTTCTATIELSSPLLETSCSAP